jgi:hypothetical protein
LSRMLLLRRPSMTGRMVHGARYEGDGELTSFMTLSPVTVIFNWFCNPLLAFQCGRYCPKLLPARRCYSLHDQCLHLTSS